MLKKKIYLAGSIYDDDIGKTWKDTLRHHLGHSERYYFFDPNPKKELFTMRPDLINYDVVAMDKKAIKNSDIVVAYVNKPSFGTTMEIHYAHSLQDISVYVINPSGLFSRDIWLTYHASMFFTSIEECARQINMVYENVIITEGGK